MAQEYTLTQCPYFDFVAEHPYSFEMSWFDDNALVLKQI